VFNNITQYIRHHAPSLPAALRPQSPTELRTPHTADTAPLVDDERDHDPGDFEAPAAPYAPGGNSAVALCRRIQALGAAGKAEWRDAAVHACRIRGPESRHEILMTMVRHGFQPDEALAAGIRFPARTRAMALESLVRQGNGPWVEQLIQDVRQGSMFQTRRDGNRRLDRALHTGQVEVVAALHRAGYQTLEQPWQAFDRTAATGELQVLQAATAAGMTFGVRHRDLVVEAARHGHLAYIAYLHEHGTPLYHRAQSNTMLLAAVRSGHLQVVDYLLRHGAQRNLNDLDPIYRPRSVMSVALHAGDWPMAQLLAEHGFRLSGHTLARYEALQLARAASA